MTAPLHQPMVRGENVLDGLSDRMRFAMVLTNFNADRAARLEQLALIDVVRMGRRAVRPTRGGKK